MKGNMCCRCQRNPIFRVATANGAEHEVAPAQLFDESSSGAVLPQVGYSDRAGRARLVETPATHAVVSNGGTWAG
jgi:hypothetical protein